VGGEIFWHMFLIGAVGFSSFAGGAKQVFKMRNFSYAF